METLLSRSEIPIIDLAHLGSIEKPTRSNLKKVAAQLHRSLAQKGIAFLVNHGIPNNRLEAAYSAMDRFCDLPRNTRELYLRHPPSNHGYVPPGVERFSKEPADEARHTFNVLWLDRGLPESEVPGFRAIVTSVAYDFQRVASLLLRVLAAGFELPTDYLLDMHRGMLGEDNETCVRLLYYPPWTPEIDEAAIRCGEHTDYGSFTLLAQDSEGGLEVKTAAGEWARVGFLPGALIINTGELLSFWTKGEYTAIPHRVVMPDQASVRSRARHAVVFFVHPDNNTPLTPLPSHVQLTNNPSPILPRSVQTAYQYLQMRFGDTYA
ncbi:uncharacterized protein LOC126263128 [Schistocerca nitens]|uniref:uncharacterized protein LOC126263128 n=1 Tax=Schistocerca nitens TaxID=7011 RepID=UPI0021196FCE|nr:uncharacterized protein LOC126263128 [Schistocerca nitens]